VSINRLLELHDLAKEECQRYPRKRHLASQLESHSGRHFIGIVGARGTGKTVLLRQFALEHEDAFYLSADTLDRDDDLWELIRKLSSNYGYRSFLLDEIHFLADPTALLKKVYDFLDARIVFSSSVALAMHASAHDLSRRVRLLDLHVFSFREYLAFAHDLSLSSLSLEQIADRQWTPDHLRTGRFFDDYLRGGVLPFSLEEPEPLGLLESIIEKVIARDLPAVARLIVDELELIRNLLRFIGRSGIDGINYSSLSRNLGITKYKAEQYVGYLVRASILHRVLPAGTNVLREPKILMAPPSRLLYQSYDDALGGLREDFFVEAIKQAGFQLQYLKSTRGAKTPDYLIEAAGKKLAVEVGGRSKGREQFKGVKVDGKLVFAHSTEPAGQRLPLFLLGFLPSTPVGYQPDTS
jgi:predicted AAA+ superfamily ATPase